MLLQTKDLQSRLGVGRDKAYALMHAKKFPSIKMGGRYYIEEEELEKWLKRYTYGEFEL